METESGTTNESTLDSGLDTETGSTEEASTNTEASASDNEGDESQSAGSNDNGGSIGAAGISGIIFGVILTLLVLACLWKIFEKFGEKGWKVLIPIFNIYVMFKIAFGAASPNAEAAPKDEFNFDDNIANINKFNNEGSDYDPGMNQMNSFEPMNNNDIGITTGLNSENQMESPTGMPGMGDNYNPEGNMVLDNMGSNNMENPNTGDNNMKSPNMNDNNMDQNNMENPNMGPNNMDQNNMGNFNMNGNMGPYGGPMPMDGNMPGPGMMPGDPNNNGPMPMMPNGAPAEGPNNNQFNNGPMPMPGLGQNAMTKQCPNCHAPVPLNLVVCPNCGANTAGM